MDVKPEPLPIRTPPLLLRCAHLETAFMPEMVNLCFLVSIARTSDVELSDRLFRVLTRAVKEAIDLLERTAKEAKQVAGRRTLAKHFVHF